MSPVGELPTKEKEVHDFWNGSPCGEKFTHEDPTQHPLFFFAEYDHKRYRQEAHILKRLDAIDFRGKRVLEIGLGLGADSEQMIIRGARWSGLDLTPASVAKVKLRLNLKKLPYEELRCGSALAIPYSDQSFDMVFSHGVLHHIPEIRKAQSEIARVLKPDGELIAMLYAKRSLNYLVAISVIRRLGLASAYGAGMRGSGLLAEHLNNASRVGLWEYLRMTNFIHRNTDGPSNPYAKVYDRKTVAEDFPDFRMARSYQDFMHAPPLTVNWLKPLSGVLGWHLWVHLKKQNRAARCA